MKNVVIVLAFILVHTSGCTQNKSSIKDGVHLRSLTPEEKAVIVNKGTERPFTGKYDNFFGKGAYACKYCGNLLYHSDDKFKSDCGWPSFDDEIKGAVKRIPDSDGMRTEINCARCGAHLGHVFTGEGLTDKNVRHCVNSVSLQFIPAGPPQNAKTDTAYVAGGCFWGVEYYMEQAPGVLSVVSGYMGGKTDNPTYQQVSSHTSGYAETTRVVFDASKTNYEKVAKLFFEIHDPTQLNHQGPDVGDQYRSEVFYTNMQQKAVTDSLIDILTKKKGMDVKTLVEPADKFWTAEEYHQNYYVKENGTPYCHKYVQRF
jgi:peptide methionine sulfoxide reductase msrA/msrB